MLRTQTNEPIEELLFGAAAKAVSVPQPRAFPLISAHLLELPFRGGSRPPHGAMA